MVKGIYQRGKNKDSLYIVLDMGIHPVTGKRRTKGITIKRGVTLKGSPLIAPANETDRQLWRRAEDEKARLQIEKRGGVSIDPHNTTVAAYLLETWLPRKERDLVKNPNIPSRTIASYKQIIEAWIIPVIGKKRLQELRPLDIQAVYDRMQDEGLSGTTRLHCHRVLFQALKDAKRWELVSRNLAESVDAPAASTAEARTSSMEELEQILAAADKSPIGPLVRLSLWNGLRLGEVLGLRWSDVELENRRLFVRQTYGNDGVFRDPKTKRSARTLTLSPEAVAVLEAHRKAQSDRYQENAITPEHDLVFANPLGQPLSQHRVNYYWGVIRDAAGVPNLRFHDLRHAYASVARKEGIPIEVVSRRLGHSQVSTTMNIYRHVMDGEDEEAALVMDKAFQGIGR